MISESLPLSTDTVQTPELQLTLSDGLVAGSLNCCKITLLIEFLNWWEWKERSCKYFFIFGQERYICPGKRRTMKLRLDFYCLLLRINQSSCWSLNPHIFQKQHLPVSNCKSSYMFPCPLSLSWEASKFLLLLMKQPFTTK